MKKSEAFLFLYFSFVLKTYRSVLRTGEGNGMHQAVAS